MMRKGLTAVLSATLLLQLSPAGAEVSRGIEYFERGEFSRAYEELMPDANAGDPRAQYIIGVILLNDLMPDAPKQKDAEYWLTRAAEQNYLRAQTELARMYKTGDHVEQNAEQMLHWYRRAAEGGDVGAQLFVADAYAYGHGVEPDLVEAYMWYEIALDYWGSLAVRAREVIAESMTAEEVAEAERRAHEWRAKHPVKEPGIEGE